MPTARLRDAVPRGYLVVAGVADTRAPAGFVLVSPLDDLLHVEELDVLPAHGGRGIGRALLETCVPLAVAAGASGLSLITFRDVPFNAPFYVRCGFRELPAATVPPVLAARVSAEAAAGFDPATRCVMIRALA